LIFLIGATAIVALSGSWLWWALAIVIALFGIWVSGWGVGSNQPWFRVPRLLLTAVLIITGALIVLSLAINGGSVPNAALVTIWLWLILLFPFYSFASWNTSGVAITAGTLAQWIAIVVIVGKSINLPRAWPRAWSVAVVVIVGASIISVALLLGYRVRFEGP